MRSSLVPVVVAALLASALGGCARVPDSGPAVPVAAPSAVQSGEPESDSVNTLLPRPGADAALSVSAYVNALRATRNPGPLGDHFLATPALRNTFSQNPSMVVVRGDVRASVAEMASGAATTTALFSADLIGTVDSDGVFAEAENSAWQVQVRMARIGGTWLFAEPPPLIVRDDQFASSFTPTTVYYAAAPSAVTGTNPQLVIPERRYVNEDSSGDLATQIVDFVLAGPSAALKPVAVNPLPKIKRTSRVAVEDGDLIVELEAQAESLDKDALNAFVAEVGWSLSASFSGSVRLTVGGRPLDVDDFSANQDQSAWKRYNPVVVDRQNLPTFAVQKGAVKVLSDAGSFDQKPLRLGTSVQGKNVRSAAVSMNLTRLAVVRDEAGSQRLWITDASGTMQPTLRASQIGRPSWGGNSVTVVVPVGGRLFEVGVGNARTPTEIQVIGPNGRRLRNITAIRLSMDGVRAVFINGTGSSAQVFFGMLTGSTGSALVLRARPLAVEGAPKDVSWYGAVTAAVAVTRPGNAGDEVSIVLAPVDGSPARIQTTRLKTTPVVRLTADPTENPEPIIPLELSGRIYSAEANYSVTPALQVAGVAPFYPG
ncbi:LpqB family beta-propeller domain-containing protein [Cryptosporangium aurantiacum]|uniref:Sporulation and spore germination n=1 Tax=Cryptosporangium aurantiacum TaxID=134849 RepID=A0A1M7RNM0_9ACTN|nr:LpqB family beta-propeller domain-containing protein [Cryptosporangium aurantiacum]SHN47819.1 Sporulation and spore germination [Cryptosporangium aurantiacum]